MLRKLSLSLLLTLCTWQHCLALEIQFLEQAAVSNTSITLGDIVRFDEASDLSIALATQIIGKAPAPGESITLLAADIRGQILRKGGLPTDIEWTGFSTITVESKGQNINSDHILQAVALFIEQKKPTLPKAEIRFIARSLPLPFTLPEGKLTWEITPSSPSIIGSSSVSVVIRVDERVRKNLWIRGDIEAIAPVAVTTVPLQRGAVITPSDVYLASRNIADFNNPCMDLLEILGKTVKRSVRADNVLLTSDVEFPSLVKKGQLVKILIRKAGLYLSATGIARMDGKLDQIIRVNNTSSNKVIFCRVTAPGIVEVQI